MNAQIQIFDLEADYLAELDEASLNVVYGGSIWGAFDIGSYDYPLWLL